MSKEETGNSAGKAMFEGAKKGDVNSFIQLMKPALPGIYHIVFQMHPDRYTAARLTSDILVSLWESLPRIKNFESLAAWKNEVSLAIAVFHKPEAEAQKSFLAMAALSVDSTPLEKELQKLSGEERKALFLFSRFGFSLERISRMLDGETVNSLRAKLGIAVGKCANAVALPELKLLSEAQLERLIESDDKNARLSILTPDRDSGIYAEYKELSHQLKAAFQTAHPPATLAADARPALEKTKPAQSIKIKSPKTGKADSRSSARVENPLTHLHLFSNLGGGKSGSGNSRKIVPALLFFVLLVGAYFVYTRYFGATTPWKLENPSGVVSNTGGNSNHVNAGETVSTGATSAVTIIIPEIGGILLSSNTGIKVEKAAKDNIGLQLTQGSFIFRSAGIPRAPETFPMENPLHIVTSLGTIETKYANFSFANESGTVTLDVTGGWVDFLKNNSVVYLKSGYAVTASAEGGIPFRKDAPAEMITLCNHPDSIAVLLPAALASGTVSDMLTLWHLLPRVSGTEREAVLTKIQSLLPPVNGPVKDGLMQLKPNEMKFLLGFALGS